MIMRWLLHHIFALVLANTLALFIVSKVLSEYFLLTAKPLWLGFLVAGSILGILNLVVRPILKMLSLPFMLISMGLFTIVINAALLVLLQWVLVEILPELKIVIELGDGNFVNYLIVAAVLGIVNSILGWLLK